MEYDVADHIWKCLKDDNYFWYINKCKSECCWVKPQQPVSSFSYVYRGIKLWKRETNTASNILFVVEIYNISAATKDSYIKFWKPSRSQKLTKYIHILQIKYNIQSIKLKSQCTRFSATKS